METKKAKLEKDVIRSKRATQLDLIFKFSNHIAL